MTRQKEHTRTINGKTVLVNKGVTKNPSEKSTKNKETTLINFPFEKEQDIHHIADLSEWGMSTTYVKDDDGGGIAFLTEEYIDNIPSVLDTNAEETLEQTLNFFAKQSGLAGVELIGNRLQWVKVYDPEGHPIGQEGYIDEQTLNYLQNFNEFLQELHIFNK